MRRLSTVGIALLLAACGSASDDGRALSAPTPAAPEPSPVAPTSSPDPTYEPGPNLMIGIVASRTRDELVVRAAPDVAGTRVTLRAVRSVWKETDVPPSAIEVGDDVTVNGTRMADSFAARYVWVNIGRLDARVVSLDPDGMVVEVQRPNDAASRQLRVLFSAFLEIVLIQGSRELPARVTDLQPGRMIGAVTYRPRDGPPRATRIWISDGQ